MPLTSFCGLLTLQVGAAVLSAVFFTLAAVILAANIFNYSNHSGYEWPINLILAIIFVIGLIVAALLMFASSYSENRSLAIISLVVIIVVTCYWIILCCFSFANSPDHIRVVCINGRCPESLWIANLRYRSIVNQTVTYDNNIYDNMYRDDPDYFNSYTSNRENAPYQYSYSKYHLVGAIVLFIINVLFFLFSAFIMWSWASELDWADYYIEDEPVVVYEEEPY